MLAEFKRHLGCAFLICVPLMHLGQAIVDGPHWVGIAASLVFAVIALSIFRTAVTASSTFVSIKTGHAAGLVLMLLPFLTKGYRESMDDRMLLGRYRSAAGITALYGVGMLGLALVCVLIVFVEEEWGPSLAFILAGVILGVSSIYSLTMAVIFSLSFIMAAIGYSFVFPILGPLRLAIAFEVASSWTVAGLCAFWVTALWLVQEEEPSRIRRRIELGLSGAVAVATQIWILKQYLAYAAGLPLGVPIQEWLRTFVSAGVVPTIFLLLWAATPLLSLALGRWVDDNESKNALPSSPSQRIPPDKVPDTLALPILGALIPAVVIAALIWFIIPLALEDITQSAAPAAVAQTFDEDTAQAATAPVVPLTPVLYVPPAGLTEPHPPNISAAPELQWKEDPRTSYSEQQYESDPWYWQSKKLHKREFVLEASAGDAIQRCHGGKAPSAHRLRCFPLLRNRQTRAQVDRFHQSGSNHLL